MWIVTWDRRGTFIFGPIFVITAKRKLSRSRKRFVVWWRKRWIKSRTSNSYNIYMSVTRALMTSSLVTVDGVWVGARNRWYVTSSERLSAVSARFVIFGVVFWWWGALFFIAPLKVVCYDNWNDVMITTHLIGMISTFERHIAFLFIIRSYKNNVTIANTRSWDELTGEVSMVVTTRC